MSVMPMMAEVISAIISALPCWREVWIFMLNGASGALLADDDFGGFEALGVEFPSQDFAVTHPVYLHQLGVGGDRRGELVERVGLRGPRVNRENQGVAFREQRFAHRAVRADEGAGVGRVRVAEIGLAAVHENELVGRVGKKIVRLP